jgi:pimeloyl-ACP methyl ester carboxylesterase
MSARRAVVLLHGWPGSTHDYDAVGARLRGHADLLVPELLAHEGGAPERAEARLDTPTTVLWGTDDPLFPTACADRLEVHFAAARLHVLQRIGHFVPLEAPDAVADAILT